MGALQVCDTQRKLLVFQLYELESLRSHCVQKAWAADMRRLSFILHRSTAAPERRASLFGFRPASQRFLVPGCREITRESLRRNHTWFSPNFGSTSRAFRAYGWVRQETAMLPLCILVPTAFLPAQAPTPALLAPALGSASLRTSKLVMMRDEGESAKAGFIASIAGSVATAPVKASALLATNAALTQQWQANTVSLAVMLSFFGIVYRYAVRDDDNDMLKWERSWGLSCATRSAPRR